MSIRPIFDINNHIVLPTIVLCNRNKHKLGAIFPVNDFEITPDIHQTNECSFKVYKEVNGVQNPLWEKIKDLKLVYMPEYDEYFQIAIDKSQSNNTVKNIVGVNLGVAELSQTILYDIEINTEIDIEREDYKISYVYDPENPDNSLLGRVLSKAPHYKINHVDPSLAKMVRSFSIDDKSIYDFLTGDLADELNCLVIVGSDRTVSLYDLEDTCLDCGHREDDINGSCPKCGSSNIKSGYGENTTIYVSTDNLSDNISLESNSDDVKNTLRVRGGDDLINAAVRAINPNGTEYINRFSDFVLEDMPDELVSKLNSYQQLYESKTPLYKEVMTNIYNAVDEILYLTSGMMPSPETDDTDASKELAKLTRKNIGNVAVQSLRVAGEITVNNAIKSVIQIFMSPGYNASIYSSSYSNGVWKGKFKVESVDNETDVAINTSNITLTITDDYETFVLQKLEKSLAKDDVDITKTYDWTLYGLNRLSSFSDAYQSCLDILMEMGVGDPGHEFYKSIYVPYYNKKLAVDAEILVRESQIKQQEAIQESNEKIRDEIQDELNFKNYLGEELYPVYCSYRREDTYKNDNYISDGLSNSELLVKAEELLEVAQKELYKASELQYSISTSIGNLFAIKEFEPIKHQFQVGNWIRVAIDGDIFKLRLIDYTIKDRDISTLQCNFSSVTKIRSGMSDVRSILSSAKSMASSFNYVAHQAIQGKEANDVVEDYRKVGLDAALFNIINCGTQDVVFDKHGITCRKYDDVLDDYLPEQLRIINNTIAFSSDNWKTVSCALGKLKYTIDGVEHEDYGLNADHVISGVMVSGHIYSGNYSSANQTGTHINLNDGTFSFAGGNLTYKEDKLSVKGDIIATGGIMGGWTIAEKAIYYGTNSLTSNKAGTYLGTDGIRQYSSSNQYVDIKNGTLTAYGATIHGDITTSNLNAVGGNIAGWSIKEGAIYHGTESITSTNAGTYIGIDGIRQYSSTNKYVDIKNGVLNAYGATINGDIVTSNLIATGGTIGGWNINEYLGLFKKNTDTIVKLEVPDNSLNNFVFSVGSPVDDSEHSSSVYIITGIRANGDALFGGDVIFSSDKWIYVGNSGKRWLPRTYCETSTINGKNFYGINDIYGQYDNSTGKMSLVIKFYNKPFNGGDGNKDYFTYYIDITEQPFVYSPT